MHKTKKNTNGVIIHSDEQSFLNFQLTLLVQLWLNASKGKEKETLTILSVSILLIILITKFINSNKCCPYVVDFGLPEVIKHNVTNHAEDKG